MRSLIIILPLLFLLLPHQSLAYISGKIPVNDKLIYCPEKITCEGGLNVTSCKYSSDNPQYWGVISKIGEGSIQKATYKFYQVLSDYHDPGESHQQTVCFYKTDFTVITLSSKNESNLEAHYDKTTKWELYPSSLIPRCIADTPNSCPLREQSGLVVFANAKDLNYQLRFSTNYNHPLGINGMRYIYIEYDNASSCWSAKQCKIDITMTSNDLGAIPIGSVIVDMDNKMKIIEILPIQSSGMNINKVEPFNAIEIAPDIYSPYYSLKIDNLTYFYIQVLANDILITDIRSRSNGNLFSHRAKEACSNTKECTIKLTAHSGGLIGTVVVDVENYMNILSVQSTRSSEIEINKINPHKIEINYPY